MAETSVHQPEMHGLPVRPMRQSRIVKRSPVYYGWVVWLVATLGWIATAPGQAFSVSLFLDHFMRDFGLDRTTVSLLFGVGTFIAAFTLTWFGREIDKYGNRFIGVIVGALFALSLVAWSWVAGPLALVVGFIAIRSLGQGALSLVNTTVIAQWFRRRRGRVISISLMLFSLFQAAYVPWLEQMLATHDWRQVWILLGAGVALTVVPLTWLLMRNRPEDYGMLPDGDAVTAETNLENDAEDHWTLAEAMRSVTFWIFVGGRVLTPMVGSGLILHQISIFASLGHSPQTTAQIYALTTILSAFWTLVFGWMTDRIAPGRILALHSFGMALTLLMALVMVEQWMLVLYAFAFSIVLGGGAVFDTTVWANLFGRRHLGAIRGFVSTAMIAGTAFGPITFGMSYDSTGNYDLVMWPSLLLVLLLLVASWKARKPEHSSVSVQATTDHL